jgi:hypothetical protein
MNIDSVVDTIWDSIIDGTIKLSGPPHQLTVIDAEYAVRAFSKTVRNSDFWKIVDGLLEKSRLELRANFHRSSK